MFLISGILLDATAVDTNGCLFALAHAVVNAENDDNWLWFLQLLLTVVQCHALQSLLDKALVLISDRPKTTLSKVLNASFTVVGTVIVFAISNRT